MLNWTLAVVLCVALSKSGTQQSLSELVPASNNSAAANAGDSLQTTSGRSLIVSTSAELLKALGDAISGDTITLKPGTYSLLQLKISLSAAGTADRPITVRADRPGEVTLELDTAEGFLVSGPHWRFENLDIVGTCQVHTGCQHAFHIVGGADNTIIRNSRIREFNAMIKGSTLRNGNHYLAANNVLIEQNLLINDTPRQTSGPVTFIDVVGGNQWVVRSNVIIDFGKDGGNKTSYGAFLKGSSTNGLFDSNLIACSMRHSGGVRIGLSFGGGGTGKKWLPHYFEHKGGVMRNNIIVNCSDAGIYLNKAVNTRIYNNTLLRTEGIDVRFAETDADIRDNVLSSFVNNRDGGKSVVENNLTVLMMSDIERLYATEVRAFPTRIESFEFAALPDTELVDSGTTTNHLQYDYCGNARLDGLPDRGAVESITGNQKCGIPLNSVWAHELEKSLQTGSASLDRASGTLDSGVDNTSLITRGSLTLDVADGIVYWVGKRVDLTHLEFALIQLLSSRPDELVSFRDIESLDVEGASGLDEADSVKAIVLNLRRKFRNVDPSFTSLVFLPGKGLTWQD